jgi:tellurite resistance protein TerC
MLALVEIRLWHWVAFIAVVLVFLALDLGVFHRKAHTVKFREAFAWTAACIVFSLAFAAALIPTRGREEAIEFLTGYLIELSLSLDNVFVIALIFAYFRVPLAYQHRVLFWGVIGALVMRGFMIGIGAALISRFHWMLYVFGAFLILTGIRMAFSDQQGVHPEQNPVLRAARCLLPVSNDFNGTRFFTRLNGRLALAPPALVLLMVETSDLVFALDSIPAVFAVTQKPFIVFSSNVLAILGLRSLYFVLANALGYFRYLKFGLSIVLAFIGARMLAHYFELNIPTSVSLLVVAGVICLSMLISVLLAQREQSPTPRSVAQNPEQSRETSNDQ